MSESRDESESHFAREPLVEDARTFAETLENVHPDPYLGHGGRVAFHRNLEELVRSIPAEGESLHEFYRRLQRFAAGVRDGHTTLRPPETNDGADDEGGFDGRFPFDFRVVGETLYVDVVYDDAHADLLGGRLLSVAGNSVSELRARQATIESADNRYQDLVNLTSTLESGEGELASLLDDWTNSYAATIETSEGTQTLTVEPVEADDPVATLETTVEQPETNGGPAYRFLDDGSTVLLGLPDCHSFRELHEFTASVGGGLDEYYDTREEYRRIVGEPIPDDDDEVVAGLPSAFEILTEMASEMAGAGTDTLVVDTRDNGGGSSMLAITLIYVLHGRDGIVRVSGDQFSVPKDSDLYRREYGDNGPIDETPNHAGFDFDSYFQESEEGATELLENLSEHSSTFADAVETGDSNTTDGSIDGDSPSDGGVYCPETTIVVTSATTYSAGTEPGFGLSKLGATIVGVPSGQSPNGPRDLLSDELPNTGLEFIVSYRYQAFLPGERGDVFEPDVELTPERFEALDRARDAEIRLALALANDELPPEN